MTIVILAGLVISLLRFVDKYFAKPMAHSIATAKLVAQGDLDRRIELFARGEFGEFARTFNRMLDRLQHSNVELESTVAKLEEEVDERVRVEQELHSESRALASAIKELESFSYSVSHDLRAPLRSIAGFSRILQEDYSEALDNEARGYLARVQNAATRMGKIIDDLLELSRVNRRPLSLGRVNLSEMALQVIKELAEAEPDRNVEVNISEGMVATTDASLARIVLANLLGNAWKYTRGKAGARIDFEPVTANGETIFRIRDNGAGFSMEYVDKLFRPFQRLHTDVEFEGTGIGLAIVERIILRQGGTIKAKAERGMGASFSFRFAVD
jgi:light-regulated signal transduction histidine kinase (bacteriophytochrome)